MPAAKSKKPPKAKPPPKQVGVDDLVRETAGSYVSGDKRFEVRQSDSNWYIVDLEQTNELGQELMHGPFASMKAAREAMPGARDIKPLLRSRMRVKGGPTPKKAAPPPPPPPPTWIDKLSASDAAEVRRLIRALEKEGIKDAEATVRRDRDGLQPAVATALLEQRIAALIDDLPEVERSLGRRLVTKIGEIVNASDVAPAPLPGWALFETGLGREPTKRRLRMEG
jgi:hypothetical protein